MIPLLQVDAFTDRPFAGNPAAVCLLPEERPDDWLQAVAAEMNLSETAFLLREAQAYRLRWFTPTVEVTLCGHATLASAHALWRSWGTPSDEELRFRTRSGLLTARLAEGWIELDFPAARPVETKPAAGLLSALGLGEAVWTGRAGEDLLVELPTEAAVRALSPDLSRVARLPARGVIVTAPAEGPWDFVSRFFAPAVGVPEDPVTGSAHCGLAPFWARRLGRDRLVGFQASARGGTVRVRWEGDRVKLGGQARTVFEATLRA